MAENSPQTETDKSPQESGGFSGDVKELFSMGGGNRWKRIVLISAVLSFFLLIICGAAWGTAAWAIGYFRGEPNGGCGGSGGGVTGAGGGIPAGASTAWHTDIVTTQFGGCNQATNSCTSGEVCSTASGLSTDCKGPTQYYAALPDAQIAEMCKKDINKCAHIEVNNPKTSKTVTLAVTDSGPCNTIDKNYVINGATPSVYSGQNLNRCAKQYLKNHFAAALDISPSAMKDLGGDDMQRFNWRFTSVAVNGSNDGCITGGGISGLSGPYSERILQVAISQLGYTASDSSTRILPIAPLTPHSPQAHNGDYNKYSGSDEHWCADFVTWVYKQAGYWPGALEASAEGLKDDHKNVLNILKVDNCKATNIQRGDIAFFGRDSDGHIYHVGIVESVDAGSPTGGDVVHTIEGNTSPNEVRRETHKLCGGENITFVGRPR